MNKFEEILIDELGIKVKSKKEVNDVLTCTGVIYLQPIKDAHYKYLRQFYIGEKR